MPYLTTNSHTIHYYDTASTNSDQSTSSNKPPIVMIHGLGSSQNYWMSVLPELTNIKTRCIALDTYGSGRSKSNGEDLSMETLGEDVIGAMDELGIEKAVLAGHSMGGPMVFGIAAKFSERVAGVVGVGPVSPKYVKREIFEGRIETVMKDGMEPLANTIPTAATNSKSTALQRSIIRELLLGQDPKSYAAHCRTIINAKEPDYAFIKAPVLILAGDEDNSAPVDGCRFILDNLGSDKKELRVLQSMGHWQCVEDGDQVGREIAIFLESL